MNDVRNQRQRSQSGLQLLVEEKNPEDQLEEFEAIIDEPVDVCVINNIPMNTDVIGTDEGELERFNRLRTLVRSGKYQVNAHTLAAAILESGDLEQA